MNEDYWLSKAMNANCYGITCKSIEAYYKHRKSLVDNETFFVTVKTKIPPKNKMFNFDSIKFVSTMNAYSWIPSDVDLFIDNSNVKLYSDNHFQNVMNIANGAFTSDRFHNDPRISDAFADKIKLDWLKSNLLNHRETVTYIYTSPGGKNILGFNSMVIKEKSIAIDLIAISNEFRRLGIAKELVNVGKKLAVKRRLLLTVGTQSNNIANDLYLKNDFKLKETYFMFHDTNTTFN